MNEELVAPDAAAESTAAVSPSMPVPEQSGGIMSNLADKIRIPVAVAGAAMAVGAASELSTAPAASAENGMQENLRLAAVIKAAKDVPNLQLPSEESIRKSDLNAFEVKLMADWAELHPGLTLRINDAEDFGTDSGRAAVIDAHVEKTYGQSPGHNLSGYGDATWKEMHMDGWGGHTSFQKTEANNVAEKEAVQDTLNQVEHPQQPYSGPH